MRRSRFLEAEFDRFLEALSLCQNTAREGFQIAQDVVRGCERAINRVENSLRGEMRRFRQSNVQMSDTIKDLEGQLTHIIGELKDNISEYEQGLRSQERRLDTFSITLFGRTMVGKSTLMEILIRGDGNSIGRGSQRTTRDVRKYEWRGLEITDVPGVAAFAGIQDEELAYNTARQADLVLFLITDDAPQAVEAAHLARVLSLGKPVIGILNIKASLSSERDIRRFVKREHKKLFEKRRILNINRQFVDLVREHNCATRFSFVPVHLDAKFRGERMEDESTRNTLVGLSRFEELEERIIREVEERGVFLRFRTFAEGGVNPLLSLVDVLLDFSSRNSSQGRVLIGKKKQLNRWADAFVPESNERIEREVANKFSRIKNRVPGFVEQYLERKDIDDAWKRIIQGEQIESFAQRLQESISRECQTKLEEFMKELEVELRLLSTLGQSQQLKKADIYNYKRYWNWGVTIASGALSIAAAIALGPWGLLAGAVGLIGFAFSWFFSDRESQLRKAREKRIRSLNNSLDKQERLITGSLKKWFYDSITKQLLNGVREQVDVLVSALFSLSDAQRDLAFELLKQVQHLNGSLIDKALELLGASSIRTNIRGIARIPGVATMLLIPPHYQFPSSTRNLLQQLLDSPVWFVVDNGNLYSIVAQAIGRDCERRSIRIDEKAKRVYVRLNRYTEETRERIRLAQQLIHLHISIEN